jgi:hypothetical protein
LIELEIIWLRIEDVSDEVALGGEESGPDDEP